MGRRDRGGYQGGEHLWKKKDVRVEKIWNKVRDNGLGILGGGGNGSV